MLCPEMLWHSGDGGGSDVASSRSGFCGLWFYLYGLSKLMANAYVKLHVARGEPSPRCYQIQLFLFNFLFSFPSLACVGHWSRYGVSRSVYPLKTPPLFWAERQAARRV